MKLNIAAEVIMSLTPKPLKNLESRYELSQKIFFQMLISAHIIASLVYHCFSCTHSLRILLPCSCSSSFLPSSPDGSDCHEFS